MKEFQSVEILTFLGLLTKIFPLGAKFFIFLLHLHGTDYKIEQILGIK